MSTIKIVNIPGWGLLNLAYVESIRPMYDEEHKNVVGYRINYCHTRTEYMSVEDFDYMMKHA